MTSSPPPSSRQVARSAIRAALARAAIDLAGREGFDRVTVDDLAAAGGVSRSTFLRYFATKEDAILVAVEEQGEDVIARLRAAPTTATDWSALRRSFDVLTAAEERDSTSALAATRLVLSTPALAARQREKLHAWRPGMQSALLDRAAVPRPVVASVRVAAALGCLNTALTAWLESDGILGLGDLLDEAFAGLAELGVISRRR